MVKGKFGDEGEALLIRLDERVKNLFGEVTKLHDGVAAVRQHMETLHTSFNRIVDEVQVLKLRVPEERMQGIDAAILGIRDRLRAWEAGPAHRTWLKGWLVEIGRFALAFLGVLATLKALQVF